MKQILLPAAICLCVASMNGQQKLTGDPIGSFPSVDYDTFSPSVTVNIPADAFDGDFNTCYASYDRSYTWVGLDLGKQCVISRVGFAPRNDGLGPGRLRLGIIEGANSIDFMDAVPIYIITEGNAPIGGMTYADVKCSRGFRYVRYVGPSDARCNIAELEFYGTEGAGDDSALYQISNLPTVIINTQDNVEPYDKENNIVSNIKIISNNGTSLLEASATTRLRGNTSMTFPKKPYRIKFDKKQKVLDAPVKAKKWTLINNYGDKTLLRNDIAFEIARRLEMEYVPYLQPVDVILNGEYKGCYQLCDQVEVNSGRVDIEEMEATDNEGDALTGGYFIEIDAYANREPSWFRSNKGIPVTIKSPDEDEITPQQSAYIRDYFNQLESRLWTSASGANSDYREMFDVYSFIKHFLVGEVSGNTDTYWSTYMYKRRSNPVMYTGPVWDFDLAFDNDARTYPVNNIGGFLAMSSRVSFAGNMGEFMRRVINNDPLTQPNIRDIWDYAKAQKGLTAEEINQYIDERVKYIDASQELNFMRWPIMNEIVHQNPVISGSYAGEVKRMKDYVTNRFDHLDKIISAYKPTSVVEAETALEGQIFGYAGEIALKGFADGSRYDVYDITGRMVSGGECENETLMKVAQGGVYLVKVVDSRTGKTTVRKFRF